MSHDKGGEALREWRALVSAPTLASPRLSPSGDLAYVSTAAAGTVLRVQWCGGDSSRSSSGETRSSPVETRSSPVETRSSPVEIGAGHTPRWSMTGERLAFVRPGADADEIWMVDAADGRAAWTTTMDGGWRVEEMEWVDDGRLAVITAPRSSDTAVGAGSVREQAPGTGPLVFDSRHGRRCLRTINLPAGTTQTFDTGALSVWETCAVPERGFVAVVSDDASESGWYHARLSLLDGAGNEQVLHRSHWQIARPRTSPDGSMVVIVEGWSSDRGHVTGEAVVVDLTGATLSTVALEGIDLTALEWVDDQRLSFTGWQSTRSVTGIVGLDGALVSMVVDADVLRDVAGSRGGGRPRRCAVRHRAGAPSRLVTGSATEPWTPIAAGEWAGLDLRVLDLTWSARDGMEIHGLLVSRSDADAGQCDPVLAIHGGPANLWTRAASPGVAALAWAGYAVILPNPRGSVGRGQRFARANLADPAGLELDDVMAAATMCRREGLVLDQPPGVVGGSYGGYLTAAAAVHHDIAAAVVMFGHPDLISARFASNNPAFYDILMGGPPSDATIGLYLERSPVFRAHAGTAPTLILHGDADRCTPIGQGEELFRALLDHDVVTELVVYPGEGHGLRSPAAQLDAWQRTIDWFGRHLGPQAVRR